jgi:hypothetical protein
MLDAMISRARMRDLTCLGRFQGWEARVAGFPALCASCAERATDATGIADSLGLPPRAASSRPGADDLMASGI